MRKHFKIQYCIILGVFMMKEFAFHEAVFFLPKITVLLKTSQNLQSSSHCLRSRC